MDQSFKNAVTSTPVDPSSSSPSNQFTFTCDWDDTLSVYKADTRKYNFLLFMFLAEMKAEGHRVIITSASPADVIRDNLELAVEFGDLDCHDFKSLLDAEIISKADLAQLSAQGKINVDVAFDDIEIATQQKTSFITRKTESLNYATPKLEVRVDPSQFSMSVDTPNGLSPLGYADIMVKILSLRGAQGNAFAAPEQRALSPNNA